MDPEC